MLTFMRKHAKNWLMKAVLVVIIVVFIFYFGSTGGKRQAEMIALVNDTPVSYGQYREAYENLLNFYREQFKNALTEEILKSLNLKERAVNQVIEEQVLVATASEMGIDVTDEEVRRSVTSLPAFQKNGVFDMEYYQQALRYHRISPEDFERQQRRALVRAKVGNIIRESAKVSKKETENLFAVQFGKIDLQYVKIPVGKDGGADPDRQTLEGFFKENAEKFRVPERMKIRYIAFAGNDYVEPGEIVEEAILETYNAGKEDFLFEKGNRKPLSKVREEILSFLRNRKGMVRAQEEARKAYESIYQDRNFEAYVREHNLPLHESDWFPRNTVPGGLENVENLAEKLARAEKGDLGPFLRDEKGFYISEVTDVEPSSIPPLDAVKASVVKAYHADKALKSAKEKAEAFLDEIRKGADFGKSAAGKGLAVSETGFFQPLTAYIPGIGESGELAASLMEVSESNPVPGKVFFSKDGFFVVRLKERQPFDVREFAGKEEQLRKNFLQYKEEELFQDWMSTTKEAMIRDGRLKIYVDPSTL
jgi:peptidyl-prolyl cis-trans isomerase D